MQLRWFVLFLCMLVPSLRAAVSGDWEYLVIGGKATIIKYRGTNQAVTVPSSLDGYQVTDIRGPTSYTAVFSNYPVTNLVLPNTLTNVGTYAFYYIGLQSIHVPEGVQAVGNNAFEGNYSLTNVVLPSTLLRIGDECIRHSAIKSINLPSGLTQIGSWAFGNNSQLTNLVIPNSVTNIGDYGFYYNTSLKSVTLPNNLSQINGGLFLGCSSLSNIVIPSTVTNIASSAFRGCGLSSVSIPDRVERIEHYAFEGCYGITNIVIGTGLAHLGNRAFAGILSLTEIRFLGNAPAFDTWGDGPFYDTPDFTLFYSSNTTGWGSTFAGRQTTLSGNLSLTLSSDPTKGSATNSPSGNSFASGTSVSVSAIPLAGYAFTSWSGDSTSTINPLVLVMNANKAVTANFGPDNNDTDGDGLSNHQEVIIFNTNPNQAETNSPVAGLYLASQYQANRAGGRNEVLASPNSYGLFNSNQMLDLKFGGMVIGKSNNQLVLTYQINQSTNLTTWTAYREESLVLSNAPADKMFLRLAPK